MVWFAIALSKTPRTSISKPVLLFILPLCLSSTQRMTLDKTDSCHCPFAISKCKWSIIFSHAERHCIPRSIKGSWIQGKVLPLFVVRLVVNWCFLASNSFLLTKTGGLLLQGADGWWKPCSSWQTLKLFSRY